jgi:hypothetical protein
MTSRFAFLLSVIILASVSVASVPAKTHEDTAHREPVRQLVVHVHKSAKGLEYEIRSYHLKKVEANYWLAEIKLRECNDCQIIPLIDDDVELGAITQISEMAINAGFKDIRPFVFWRNTGRIAEVQFGPPIKFTGNEEKLERRMEKSELAPLQKKSRERR